MDLIIDPKFRNKSHFRHNRNMSQVLGLFLKEGNGIEIKKEFEKIHIRSVFRKFQDHHQKSHLKTSKKFETIFFIQNNLPLLRYNGGHDLQVISCLRGTQISECSSTSVPHLFGFPQSRRCGFPSSTVWVWVTRSSWGDSYPGSMANGRGPWHLLGPKTLGFCRVMWRSIVMQEEKILISPQIYCMDRLWYTSLFWK